MESYWNLKWQFPASSLINDCLGINTLNYGPFKIYYFIASRPKYQALMKTLNLTLIMDMGLFLFYYFFFPYGQ
jgi:hypothetical protein